MNTILTVLFLLVAVLALTAWIASRPRGSQINALANVGEGNWGGLKSYLTDAVIGTRYLVGKLGSDAEHIAVAVHGDIPLGVITDEAGGANEPVTVQLLGSHPGTVKVVADAAIAAGAFVVLATTAGRVRTLPGTTGTYYIIGRALTAAGAAGDELTVDPTPCVQRVVP